jgi:hypothetical protein
VCLNMTLLKELADKGQTFADYDQAMTSGP